MILAEIVGYSMGALCIATAVPLSFRRTSGASGSFEAFGVKVAGKGMGALFLLVGAAMITVVVGLSMTRKDLQEKKEELVEVTGVKNEAVEAAQKLSTALSAQAQYVRHLQAEVPPAFLEEARNLRPQVEFSTEALSPRLRAEMARVRPLSK